MKCVFIPADTCEPEIKDLGEPLYKTAGAEVGGWIEIVHPKYLPSPFCMIVNEEGLIRDLPYNTVGSYWYGTREHGYPIAGDIVVMKDGFKDGEPDIVGLTDEETVKIVEMVSELSELITVMSVI